MASDLISVIIPCYRQARYLSEAIESVRAQTYAPVECIVVDDGSPDNTREIAARYPEVRYLAQENQGVSAARNKGMREAHGEYLIFLDADDRLLPAACETNLKYHTSQPPLAFVSGQRVLIKPDGSLLSSKPQLVIERDHYARLLRANYIGCTATVLHRREALEACNGFDPALKSAEDYKLYLELTRRFPVVVHPEFVAEYRFHDANTSSNHAQMLACGRVVLGSQWEHVCGNSELSAAYRSGMARMERQYKSDMLVAQARAHARAGQWKEALPDAFALLRHDPLAFAVHAGRKLRRLVSHDRSAAKFSEGEL